MKETILIIGCGEIGTALISGWLKKRKDFKKKISRIYILEKSIARKKGDIGFSVTRGGEDPGEDTVSFIGHSDRIDLFHKASNISIFVSGAIEASIFVSKKKRGLFNMKDLF